MTGTIRKTYKGWTMELSPHGQGCSTFALTFTDPVGHEVRHMPLAGNTEEIALERGREMIDIETSLTEH